MYACARYMCLYACGTCACVNRQLRNNTRPMAHGDTVRVPSEGGGRMHHARDAAIVSMAGARVGVSIGRLPGADECGCAGRVSGLRSETWDRCDRLSL